jgi:hypothetical protein
MNKMQENAETKCCNICNFNCSKQSNYNTHLLSAKHKRLSTTNEKMPKYAPTHICSCGKTYKHLSSLYKHRKSCSPVPNSTVIQENQEEKPSIMDFITQSKEIMDMLVLQNKEQALLIKEQSEELKRQNKEHSDTIRELIPKIGNNNNNTTTNNNQFNLQVFLNEDCKEAINFSEFIESIKVSFADLENQAENGYIKGISKLFIENLQSLGINKRPIHCTDKKRKTLYIKENDAWDKEGSLETLTKGIQEVSRRTFEELIKSKEENAEEYKDNESEFSNKCVSIQRNLVPNYPRETTIKKVIENISQNTDII